MKYNKLVRDKIPAIIKSDGKECKCRNTYVHGKEYRALLIEKMCEELVEFSENPCVEEAADIYEVFTTLLSTWQVPLTEVIKRAEHKREERGGFKAGIVLMEVSGDKNTI